MNFREEFFKSPHPRSFDYFNFPTDKIHHDGEQLFENHLFPNLARDPKTPYPILPHPDSPFSYVHNTPLNSNKHLQGDKMINSFAVTPISEKNQKPICKPTQHMIDQKINFNQSEQDQFLQTPCKVLHQHGNQGNQTTATKKYDLRFAGSATSRKTTRQNQRGLRVLSKLAYQIVLESGPTTYKQVADKLISEQNEEEKMDRQNIKRRVYDALNVLIALGQLDKKGRKIIKSKKRQKMQQEENKLIQNKSKLQAKLKKRKEAVTQKKQQRQRILKINKSLKKLININMNQRRQQNKIIDQKLNFPLVFMQKVIPLTQGLPSTCHLQSNGSQTIMIRGQSDAVSHLSFPHK